MRLWNLRRGRLVQTDVYRYRKHATHVILWTKEGQSKQRKHLFLKTDNFCSGKRKKNSSPYGTRVLGVLWNAIRTRHSTAQAGANEKKRQRQRQNQPKKKTKRKPAKNNNNKTEEERHHSIPYTYSSTCTWSCSERMAALACAGLMDHGHNNETRWRMWDEFYFSSNKASLVWLLCSNELWLSLWHCFGIWNWLWLWHWLALALALALALDFSFGFALAFGIGIGFGIWHLVSISIFGIVRCWSWMTEKESRKSFAWLVDSTV